MRTIFELPDPLYRRMRALAVARGTGGVSSLIGEAVREYLERGSHKPSSDAFAAARGAWGIQNAASFEIELRDAWTRNARHFARVPGQRVVAPDDW